MNLFRQNEEGSTKRNLPYGIRLRRGTGEDEFPAFEVMRKAMGYEVAWANHASARNHLRTSPNSSFWVATEGGRFGNSRVMGYARSLVRDRVWQLTEFFVLPNHHRQGIGGGLLGHCLEEGEQAGADTRLVLASLHPAANSLYIRRAGCFPRLPMFLMAGPPSNLGLWEPPSVAISDPTLSPSAMEKVLAGSSASVCLQAEPLILTPGVQAEIDSLDREFVGYARPPEHRFWEMEMGGRHGASRLFRQRHGANPGSLIGYAYWGSQASGPMVSRVPTYLPALFTHVAKLSQAASQRGLLGASVRLGFSEPSDAYCAVAGTNEVVVRWLLGCGWRIISQYLFMSSRPLGQFDHYICHNPLHLL